MKFAFSRPTGGSEEQGLLFETCRSAGYDGMQLKAGQYRPHLADPASFAADWGRWPGLTAGLITGGRPDQDGADSFRDVLQFAQAVGTELIVYCIGVGRKGLTRGDIRAIAGRMSEWGQEGCDAGMKLSIHNHFDSPLMGRDDFDAFFDAVADGTVGLTLDTAHAAKSGIDEIAELIRSFSSVIDNFHLKDYAEGRWRVLGEGRIDFDPVFKAIRDTGFDGWVSTDEESGGEIDDTVGRCLGFMKRGLT